MYWESSLSFAWYQTKINASLTLVSAQHLKNNAIYWPSHQLRQKNEYRPEALITKHGPALYNGKIYIYKANIYAGHVVAYKCSCKFQ